jgi:hypothetical protein
MKRIKRNTQLGTGHASASHSATMVVCDTRALAVLPVENLMALFAVLYRPSGAASNLADDLRALMSHRFTSGDERFDNQPLARWRRWAQARLGLPSRHRRERCGFRQRFILHRRPHSMRRTHWMRTLVGQRAQKPILPRPTSFPPTPGASVLVPLLFSPKYFESSR